MNQQLPTNYNYEEDEIDLKELLAIVIKEKKVVFITFLVVFILSLIGAFYERDLSKKVEMIVKVEEKYKNINFLPNNVLEKIYRDNNVFKKNKISLDKFKEEFKITGIIPKEIKLKQEALEKKGETLNYIPSYYLINLRVGSILESIDILNDYYKELNADLRYKNESRYRFKKIDKTIIDDKNYDYQDYLNIIKERESNLYMIMKTKYNLDRNYISYGFGYRECIKRLEDLYNLNINELQNYLDATNIVKNKEKFLDSYENKMESLKNELNLKEKQKNNYREILRGFKLESKEKSIPQGVKVSLGDSEKEKYYIKITDEYLETQKSIANLKNEIEKLELKKERLKSPNDREIEYIDNSLNNIIVEYNQIVDLANKLEDQENKIEYKEIVQKVSPVTVISNSKAKLICAVGVVLGVFLGIMAAFIKNFFKDFKKYILMATVFIFIGTNSFSKEKIKILFTHKEMSVGKNPDRTPFDLNEEILRFLNRKDGIKVIPVIDKDSSKNIKKMLEEGKDSSYIPTQYEIIVDLDNKKEEEEIVKQLKEKFPEYYIDIFFKGDRYSSKPIERKNYRQRLSSAQNSLDTIEQYIIHKSECNKVSQEKRNEYRNLKLEVWRIKNTELRDLKTYINSKKLVLDEVNEKILLGGEKENLIREIKNKKELAVFYMETLKNYSSSNENEATLSEDGDVIVKNENGSIEKQYIKMYEEYLETLKDISKLERRLAENQNFSQNMRVVTDEESVEIEKQFILIEKDINDLNNYMKNIELRDYNKEYNGSVRILK